MEKDIRNVGGYEFEVTKQVRYDAVHMSLPEFVTYQRSVNGFLIEDGVGSDLRELFFDLREDAVHGQGIDKSLTKSSIVKWRQENPENEKSYRRTNRSMVKAEKKGYFQEGVTPEELREAAHTIYPGDGDHKSGIRKQIPKKKKVEDVPATESAVIVPVGKGESKIEEVSDYENMSRKEQVKYWMDKGMTSTKQIADHMGANPSYVQRLKKQLQDG